MQHNPVLDRLIRTRQFKAKGRMLPVKYCISQEIGERYYETIRQGGFHRALEVGSLFGFSSLFLAQALAENGGQPQMTIVDARIEPLQWDGEPVYLDNAVVRHLAEAGYDRFVEFNWGRSQDILPKLHRQGRRYEFILVDGDHRFASVLLDMILADSMLEVGGVMAMDDIGYAMAEKENLHGCANRALAHLFATNRYRIEVLNGNCCLCWKLRDVG